MKIAESPAFLESVANDPRVFPSISVPGMARIDLAPAWRACIGLEFDTGGWILHRSEPGVYEVHTLFLPKSRQIREKAREAMLFVFSCTDAIELLTKVPADLPHARALTLAMGFRPLYRREAAWPREGGAVAVDYFRLGIEDWIVGNEALEGLGHWFHDQLGAAHVNHAECAVHDAYAGFAVLCGKQNRIAKGAAIYNRWARFAGFEPIRVIDGAVQFGNLTVRDTDQGLQVSEDAPCPQPQ